jgi:S1-C subfamily serine protease
MRGSFALAIAIVCWVSVTSGVEPAPKTAIEFKGNAAVSQLVDIDTLRRISTSLQKSGKNLILEGTRGEKDVTLFQKAAPAVVFILAGKTAIGSGGIISQNGDVITNWHVVRSNSQIIVVLKPYNSADLKKELAFAARVEKIDQIADLALLKIINPPVRLPILSLGDSASLNVGQDVHAIGHPEGEVWTYTKGIISQIRANYQWKTEEGIAHRANVIQTQTPINPGNSGGPLLDDGGRLVGINSFKSGGEALNYAVSVDTIKEFLSRESNREVPENRPQVTRELRCTEGYDTMRRGWNDIVGCYQDAVGAPPDVWFVFRLRNQAPNYTAMDSDTSGRASKIDLIRKGRDPQWQSTDLYLDSNCDGIVDLIATQRKGSDEVLSSRLPPTNLKMTTLAAELHSALQKKIIPYGGLRVCQ